MRRVTQADIDEMRARGYDPRAIQEAEVSAERTKEADALCAEVRNAFLGVCLNAGVGLSEGQAIDDYASEEVRSIARADDEKMDWEKIQAEDLRACHSSLSFFDALGMRFHLPAFIIADLKDQFGIGMEFVLTDHSREKFALLNPEQRKVVRKYLQLLRSDPDSQFDYEQIDRALSDYWIEAS